MSLTSQLDNPASPLSIFLAEHLPGLGDVRKDFRRRLPQEPVPRPVWPATAGTVPWGTLGHAIDMRLRLALDPTAAPSVDARSPARSSIDTLLFDGVDWADLNEVLPRSGSSVVRLPTDTDASTSRGRRGVGAAALDVLTELADLLQQTTPHRLPGLLLKAADERRLCRMLMVCAWLEEVFRTGLVWPGSVLDRLSRKDRVDASTLLAAVPAAAVTDLVATLRRCERAGVWQQLRAPGPAVVVSGPTFAGSALVGGADADVIVDGLLIDIKATVCPKDAKPAMFGQLLGYVLLDTDDRYEMTGAGIFLARQGVLIDWTMDELLTLARAQLPLAELRVWCAKTAENGSRARSRAARRPATAR